MDLAAIITKIKTDCATDFRLIGGAAELDAAIDGLKSAPAAFVVPVAESAAENGLYGATAQLVTMRFAVVMAVSNIRDGKGEGGLADLQALRQSIRAAIFGWQPTAEHTTIQIAGGQMLDFRPGVIWWQDTYRTSYEERAL